MRITRTFTIGLLALGLAALLAPASASAQNLIQNPGFENNPPPNFGNNIGWGIPPWIVGSGQQPNVVKVDGGAHNYGNAGPKVDATAPGTGIDQHYLDITDGSNDFYQSFTVPACPAAPAGTDAKIKFGGSFSGRGNAGGTATIRLRQGNGLTGAIIQTLTVTVAAGNSSTDPWVTVTGTATLSFGTTFSYVVAMPNPMNFDNAFLTLETNPCVDPPPPPPTKACLDAKGDVTCNQDGTASVTITTTNYSGSDITVTSLTPGVTVMTSQQPFATTTTWKLAGASPGQTVKLSVTGTKAGGGSVNGSDECCGTEITVVMPDCVKPPPTGELIVVKKVVFAGAISLPILTYPVTVTCGTWSKSFALVENVPQSVGGAPLNTDCTVTEVLPPPPAGACPGNMVGVWAPPTYAPPLPFQMTGTTTTLTVTNTLECKPVGDPTGELIVVKKVNYSGPLIMPSLTYPVTVTCGTWSKTFNLVDNVPQSTGGVPQVSCSVTESLPPAPASACPPNQTATWQPLSVAPSNPFTPSGITTTVTATNTLECKPQDGGGGQGGGGNGYLLVNKSVQNNPQLPLSVYAGMTFQVTATCGSIVRTLNLNTSVAQAVTGVPVGTVCTLSEAMPLPPLPSSGGNCPAGTVPTWGTPFPQPASVTMTSGAGPHIAMVNPVECKAGTMSPPPPPLACAAPLTLNVDKSACVCPQGMTLRGRECVKTIACRAPMVPNGAGTACVCSPGLVQRGKECVARVACASPAFANPQGTACLCPQGMVKRGNTCVRREQEGPRIRTEDVIRVVPGLVPGFGGGGGRGGGDKGGSAGGSGAGSR